MGYNPSMADVKPPRNSIVDSGGPPQNLGERRPSAFGRGCLRRVSLRWFFIAIALLGIWIGWQKRIVDERKAVRRWLAAQGHDVANVPVFEALARQDGRNPTGVSWCLRQAIGDSPLRGIVLHDPTDEDDEELERVQRVFPEAILLPVFSEKSFERYTRGSVAH